MSNAFVETSQVSAGGASRFLSGMMDTVLGSDMEVRKKYNEKVSQAYLDFLKEAAVFHEANQCFGEDLARKASAVRNEIKYSDQAKTSWFGRTWITLRNLVFYHAPNASYETLAKTKNPEEIAYSAFKTNGSDLGLKGNGLGVVLDTWNAIKGVSNLYPEDITPAMVEAFKAQPKGKVDPAVILAARDGVPIVAQADMPKPILSLEDLRAILTVQERAPVVDQTDMPGAVDESAFSCQGLQAILTPTPQAQDLVSINELVASAPMGGPRRNFSAYI